MNMTAELAGIGRWGIYIDDITRNKDGYTDPHAYKVFKKEQLEEERFKRLMATIFYICENAGFHIEERMVIKDLRTGRIWR